MNSLNVFGLALAALVLIFLVLRVERRVLWLALLLVAASLLVLARWASLGGHWGEALLALAIALPLTVAWWLIIGRRLPRPDSDNIKVFGQEKLPRPKPEETRALQSENDQLRQQNERLEVELRNLKGGHNGDRPPGAN